MPADHIPNNHHKKYSNTYKFLTHLETPETSITYVPLS